MNYIEEKIIEGLYTGTISGKIKWDSTDTNGKYNELMSMLPFKPEIEACVCEIELNDESYYAILNPYHVTEGKPEIRILLTISKGKEYLYSRSFSEGEIEGLWWEAKCSKEPLGKLLRYFSN